MEYFCESCNTVQYEEDLDNTVGGFDEPPHNLCGYCQSDYIVELDTEEAIDRLYTTVKYLAKHAFPDNEWLQRAYITKAVALCEWLDEHS